MATATARKVDEAEYRLLTEIAASNDRSVSAELRVLIAERVKKHKLEMTLAEMHAIREMTKGKLGPYPDSVSLIRAVRDKE